MSKKTRNIIAITVALVAVAAIIVVIVLASITIKPMQYNGWLDGYENAEISVYYNGRVLSGTTDKETGKLVGTGGDHDGEYSYKEIIESMNFSMFSACIQFNYDYKLRLEDETSVSKNELTVSALNGKVEDMKKSSNNYTFVIKFAEKRTLMLKDKDGSEATQNYDTAVFQLSEDSDWARMLTAYVFVADDLKRNDPDALANTKYYALNFGARTSTIIDILDLIYNNAE